MAVTKKGWLEDKQEAIDAAKPKPKKKAPAKKKPAAKKKDS